jgi:bacillithiol system protein YtxJ
MNWIPLENEHQLDEIIHKSTDKPQVIFKHSTRCSISSMAKNRLDKKQAPEGLDFYYLDLIRHRNISNRIASEFNVVHQSPQVLVINNGKCVYDESHSGIMMEEIVTSANNA